jgi:hypothetical protein
MEWYYYRGIYLESFLPFRLRSAHLRRLEAVQIYPLVSDDDDDDDRQLVHMFTMCIYFRIGYPALVPEKPYMQHTPAAAPSTILSTSRVSQLLAARYPSHPIISFKHIL